MNQPSRIRAAAHTTAPSASKSRKRQYGIAPEPASSAARSRRLNATRPRAIAKAPYRSK